MHSAASFGIAGDWHGVLLRVFAPQRGLRCMGNCMGLSLDFSRCASPWRLVDVANDDLVRIDCDVFDRDRLLSGSAMAIGTGFAVCFSPGISVTGADTSAAGTVHFEPGGVFF